MRRLLYRLLYGPSAWRVMWALEQRCAAANVNVGDALVMATLQAKTVGYAMAEARRMTQRYEAIARMRRHWPRLPVETTIVLVRLAGEAMAVEEAGDQ